MVARSWGIGSVRAKSDKGSGVEKEVTRRKFLTQFVLPWGMLGVFTVGLGISEADKQEPGCFDPSKTYGYISADTGGARFKVYLNDEDVSCQSFEANDREGWVGLYDADLGGITWPLHRRRVYGKVVIRPSE